MPVRTKYGVLASGEAHYDASAAWCTSASSHFAGGFERRPRGVDPGVVVPFVSERRRRIAALRASLSRPSPPPSPGSRSSSGRSVRVRAGDDPSKGVGRRVEGRRVREAVARDQLFPEQSRRTCAPTPFGPATFVTAGTARVSRRRVSPAGAAGGRSRAEDRRKDVDRPGTVVEVRPDRWADGAVFLGPDRQPRPLRDGRETPIPKSFVVTPYAEPNGLRRRRSPTSRTRTLKVTSVLRRTVEYLREDEPATPGYCRSSDLFHPASRFQSVRFRGSNGTPSRHCDPEGSGPESGIERFSVSRLSRFKQRQFHSARSLAHSSSLHRVSDGEYYILCRVTISAIRRYHI